MGRTQALTGHFMAASMQEKPSEEARRWRMRLFALLLVAVPLVLVTGLALRTIDAERTAGDSRRLAAARDRGLAVAGRLEPAVMAAVEDGEAAVMEALAADPGEVGTLRRLVSDGTVDFAVLLRGDGRIFPPENPNEALLQERTRLARIGPALSIALSRAKGQKTSQETGQERGLAWSLVDDRPALVSCRAEGAERTLCLTVRPDQALRSLTMEAAQKAYPWDAPMAIVDPWSTTRWRSEPGDPPERTAATTDLADGLEGWKIRTAVTPDPAFAYATLGASILAPVVIGWGMALWSLLRRQADAVAEERHRAANAARLSHDLRTPLSNLLLYVDLIARNSHDGSPIGRYCAILEDEIARLRSIAAQAVREARGEPGEAGGTAPVVPDAIVAALIARYEPLMREAGCTVAFSGNAGRPVFLESCTLERIVVNLLDNARRHAAGSRVTIATRIAAERLTLQVADDGAKEPAGKSAQAHGFGLGLRVVAELAATCGGRLDADIGTDGARFTVALPLGKG